MLCLRSSLVQWMDTPGLISTWKAFNHGVRIQTKVHWKEGKVSMYSSSSASSLDAMPPYM